MKVQWTNDEPVLGEWYWFIACDSKGSYKKKVPVIRRATKDLLVRWHELMVPSGWLRSYSAIQPPRHPYETFQG